MANPNKPPSQDIIDATIGSKELDIVRILPSQRETGIRLDVKQEETRAELATQLIRILTGTLIGSFLLILLLVAKPGSSTGSEAQETRGLVEDLITFVITSQTGLIGTALGFYFGSKSQSSNR